MLYCVSYSNGAVGIFSSFEKVKELVFDKYPSITFIIQVFKNNLNTETKSLAWAVMHKDTELYAYVSDSKEEAMKVVSILDTIGKAYDELIDYWEQEIDVISECVESILIPLNKVYGEGGVTIDSTKNIIYYS